MAQLASFFGFCEILKIMISQLGRENCLGPKGSLILPNNIGYMMEIVECVIPSNFDINSTSAVILLKEQSCSKAIFFGIPITLLAALISISAPVNAFMLSIAACCTNPESFTVVPAMSKTINLSDLEWDFSDADEVTLSLPKGIELVISRDELNSFIESWE